ncbi:Protein arv1 [Zea mays]|uniref:Protein ARV n=1 Tax=Zea mays TaxID=4577 RepID=A0A317Y2V7_MAIZE|nr:Protein arv1 [Zea mays]
MSDAQATGDGPRCVGCGGRVKTLFVQYSTGNIRLMKCDKCKAVADPYIECEFMIILIDLVLHKTRAYRHVLFNKLSMGSSVDKGILYRSTLIHIALDTCCWRCIIGKHRIYIHVNPGSAIYSQIIFRYYKVVEIKYRDILFAVIISSYFKLFLFTMMVWEFPSSVIFIVEMFVLSSNVVALRVVSQFPRAHCFAVCLLAHAAKYLTQRRILGTP